MTHSIKYFEKSLQSNNFYIPLHDNGKRGHFAVPYKQFYLILAGKPGAKFLPAANVSMQKRTYQAYEEVFEKLKTIAFKYGIKIVDS